MKTKFINGSLFLTSILIALLMTEGLARLFLDSPNFLSPAMVQDDILKHHVPGNAPGYDKWGFKNNFVPDSADIVTIGDSQTFGIKASIGSTWPNQLQEISNKSVYNLSMEGYGPVQYFHLFKTKALKLNPEHVIIGFYIGNDPLNTFEMVYNYQTWQKLRNPDFSKWLVSSKDDTLDYYLASNPLFNVSMVNNFANGLKNWLAGNSVLYRLTVNSKIVESIKRGTRVVLGEESRGLKYSFLSVPAVKINEGFRPVQRAFKMDISNKKIQEGLRLTFQLFNQIKAKCDQLGIKFTVLFIPTKEMVYCHYLYDNEEIKYSEAINQLLNNEQIIREISIKYFLANDINFIDALPRMQQAADEIKMYPPNLEQHPNKNGYGVIAQSVYDLM